MSPSDDFVITLDLLGVRRRLKVPREREALYRKAAKMVNDKYTELTRRISTAGGQFDIQSYLSLVALEFSLRSLLENEENEKLKEQLKDLEGRLDQILG